MRYSTQTLALSKKYGIKYAISSILDAGFTAIDLTMSYGEEKIALGEDYISLAGELRSMAEDRGAVFNQAHAPFGGGVDFYLENTVPTLPRIFDFAARLGAECIVVHPIALPPHKERYAECFERNLELYTRLAPYARRAGIKIAIENMWERERGTEKIIPAACADPKEQAALFDALSDPETFTVCLDVGHTALTGFSPEESIRVLENRLGATHIHDTDLVTDTHTIIGGGRLSWDSIARALGEVNYTGYLTLECDKGYLKDVTKESAPHLLTDLREAAAHLAEKVELYRKI